MKQLEIQLEIHAPSGKIDRLTVTKLTGEERIGALYHFDVHFVQEDAGVDLDLEELLGSRATLSFLSRDSGERRAVVDRLVHARISKIVRPFHPSDDDKQRTTSRPSYHVRLEPQVGVLSRFSSQEIFVGESVPEVISAKLKRAHFSEHEFALHLREQYPHQDGAPEPETQGRLIIQYKESDLAFISRLSEHLGISFFFQSEGEHEQIVFSDHNGGFAEREEPVPFSKRHGHGGIRDLEHKLASVPTDFYVYDYNYRTPTLTYHSEGAQLFDILGGEAHLPVESPGTTVEYAPNVKTHQEAAMIARLRSEEEEGRRDRIVGRGAATCLFPGLRFKVDQGLHHHLQEVLLVVSLKHTYAAAGFHSTGDAGHYENEFETVRAEKVRGEAAPIPYRPERLTPKPRISGVVTGIIQTAWPGQSPTLQHIDGQGRYIVKLHLDPTHKRMPWMRMGQPHSGPGYGHHFPLRAGAEVLVAFIDGDLDRPVIVGTVPNPVEKSPVVRPHESEPVEISRIRTRSGVMIEISDGTIETND